MNIPDEVIREASTQVGYALWSTNPSPHEVDVVRLAAPVIAEWARKEALREAAEAADQYAAMLAAPSIAGIGARADIRALAEGDN